MSASKGMRFLWALLVFRALSCVNFDAEAAWVGHGDLLSRKKPRIIPTFPLNLSLRNKTANGTGSNRQNLALSNVGAQIAIAVTLQTVESNLARRELT